MAMANSKVGAWSRQIEPSQEADFLARSYYHAVRFNKHLLDKIHENSLQIIALLLQRREYQYWSVVLKELRIKLSNDEAMNAHKQLIDELSKYEVESNAIEKPWAYSEKDS
jgi:hypothetical protein